MSYADYKEYSRKKLPRKSGTPSMLGKFIAAEQWSCRLGMLCTAGSAKQLTPLGDRIGRSR
jgi:hypothetical protein